MSELENNKRKSNSQSRETYTPSGMYVIPRYIRNFPGMTFAFMDVYEQLQSFWGMGLPAFMSKRMIIERTQLSKSSVYDALKFFLDNKLIAIQKMLIEGMEREVFVQVHPGYVQFSPKDMLSRTLDDSEGLNETVQNSGQVVPEVWTESSKTLDSLLNISTYIGEPIEENMLSPVLLAQQEDTIPLVKPQLDRKKFTISEQTIDGKLITSKFEYTDEDIRSGFADLWDAYENKANFSAARKQWYMSRCEEHRVEIMDKLNMQNKHHAPWKEKTAAGTSVRPQARTYLLDQRWQDPIEVAEGVEPEAKITADHKQALRHFVQDAASRYKPTRAARKQIAQLLELYKGIDDVSLREAKSYLEKIEESEYARSTEEIQREAAIAMARIENEKKQREPHPDVIAIRETLEATKRAEKEKRVAENVASSSAVESMRKFVGKTYEKLCKESVNPDDPILV